MRAYSEQMTNFKHNHISDIYTNNSMYLSISLVRPTIDSPNTLISLLTRASHIQLDEQ